jgi:LuxR family quorum-sensing system transcriptional regulator SolR
MSRNLCAVFHDGEEYYVAGRSAPSGLAFWIERPAGKIWLHINQPIGADRGVSPADEVAALTADDPSGVLADVAMKSGWFERTGRSVQHPANETNEVWRITDKCRQALMIPRIEAGLIAAASPALPDFSAVDESEVTAMLASWVRSMATAHVTAAIVLAPDPYSDDPGRKLMVASFPPTLKAHEEYFTRGPGASIAPPPVVGKRPPLATWFFLDDQSFGEGSWQRKFMNLGFKTGVRISFPATAGRSFECLLLGPSRLFDTAEAAITAWHTLNVWPELLASIARVRSPLSPRESQCLMLSASGYTGVQTAEVLGCTERTVRHHLTNGFAKLGTQNKASAIQKAQLMGIL